MEASSNGDTTEEAIPPSLPLVVVDGGCGGRGLSGKGVINGSSGRLVPKGTEVDCTVWLVARIRCVLADGGAVHTVC